jgi:hypothetical protein
MSQYFYCHWDNYPEGAAEYFSEALAMDWKDQVHGKTILKKFASIGGPMFISRPDEIGGIEYRYDVTETDDQLLVQAYGAFDTHNLEMFFDGTMEEFIKRWGTRNEQLIDKSANPITL